MATVLTLRERFNRKAPRVRKFVRQWVNAALHGRRPARPIFVVGSQRSGTRLPLMVMDQSPDIITYNEGSAPFFDRVLLRPLPEVRRHMARMPFPIVVLKPICESHRTPELLHACPGSRAVWIYRDYRDTVNSAVVKWTSGRAHVRELAMRDLRAAGWRAGGLSAEQLDMVSELYTDDMSPHAAEAVMWYLRNSLFFNLNLSARKDVLLVKYEDLVTNPEEHFPPLFEFLACEFRPEFLRTVYRTSVRRQAFPEIPRRIAAMCEEISARLDAEYARAQDGRGAGHELRSALG